MSIRDEGTVEPDKRCSRMVTRPDLNRLIFDGLYADISAVAQGSVHGGYGDKDERSTGENGGHAGKANNVAGSAGIWIKKMIFVSSIKDAVKSVVRKILRADVCELDDITTTVKKYSETMGDIEKIEQRRLDIEKRLDALQATINGDPEWFLKVDRERDKTDGRV